MRYCILTKYEVCGYASFDTFLERLAEMPDDLIRGYVTMSEMSYIALRYSAYFYRGYK